MPEVRSPRLAVFDCDGTLVDSQHSITTSMFNAFDARAHPRPEAEAVRQVVGLSLHEAMVRLLPGGGADDHDGLVVSYKEAFTDLRNKGEVDDPLYPGAVEVLEALEAAGWILGVATGKGSRGLLMTLETHHLTGRFHHAPAKLFRRKVRECARCKIF